MEAELVGGVILIGLIHGVLPDHGWPIAATYALNRPRRWVYGVAAGLVLGVGHLISSVALVAAYFWFSGFTAFAEGPWLRYVAGAMLIGLGVREYYHGGHGHPHDHDEGHDHDGEHGHSHGHDEGHEHGHSHSHDGGHDHDAGHSHGHDHDADHGRSEDHAGRPSTDGSGRDGAAGLLAGLRDLFGGGHRHLGEEHAERGMAALGTTALLLGFAHEEPIQILAICVGTPFCLELMLIYSLAVIVAILVPTLLLIAGYERHRETVERYTPYLPTVTAAVLIGMGLAFLTGLL